MDSPTFALFQADFNAQRLTIERVFTLLNERAEGLHPDNPEKLESVAYQIHNFYGAVEELLKVVAVYCENNISNAAQWHSLLLKRMTQPVEGIRPAVLSLPTYDLLNQLRGFRHFFRHAYGVPLDFEQLQSNVAVVMRMKPLLDADADRLLQAIKAQN